MLITATFSAVHFSFVSSLVGVPFDRTDNALTIFRCGTAGRYEDVN